MSAPDTVPGFESITPPDSVWVNASAARVGPADPAYRPGRRAAKEIACPILVCVVRPRLAGGRQGGRAGRAGRAAGRGRALPDRALRDLHRRVVRARGVTPGRVPGRATSAHDATSSNPSGMPSATPSRSAGSARGSAGRTGARDLGASLFEVPPGARHVRRCTAHLPPTDASCWPSSRPADAHHRATGSAQLAPARSSRSRRA